MDFHNANRLFADKDFDGTLEVVIKLGGEETIELVLEGGKNTPSTSIPK